MLSKIIGKFCYSEVEADVLAVRLSLVALLPMFFLLGVLASREHNLLAFSMVGLAAIPLWTFVRAAKVEFGRQGMLRQQFLVVALTATPVSLAIHVPWALLYHITTSAVVMNIVAVLNVIVTVPLALHLGTRGLLPGVCCCFLRGLSPFLFGWRDTPAHSPWLGFCAGIAGLLACCPRYRVEQHTMALLGVGMGSALSAGGHLDLDLAYSLGFFTIACIMAWLEILWMRRRRQLPPDLKGCKFVSLAYLRELDKNGGIQRCQDLPPKAFGDPAKARVLLVISHRWMNRFTCDVFSSDHPEGLRLGTMLERLEKSFSVAGLWASGGLRERLKRFSWSITTGSDVLLFFDYMSLPQIGLKDGLVVERTDEEMSIFKECLPAMGVLYSMFPVMVCQEVEPGMTSYLESGWCFSECCTAWLGGQLDDFSWACTATQWFSSKAAGMEHDLPSVAQVLEDCLCDKKFLHESDRDIVRSIIRGYAVKRRLIESISSKCLPDLDAVLWELHQGQRLNFLDQPVDADLNTPLHLAVKTGFPEGVRRLLDSGADKTLRNLAGDTPVQWYIWPRISLSAQVCRQHAQGRRSFQEVARMLWFSESHWFSDAKTRSDIDSKSFDCTDAPSQLKEVVVIRSTTDLTHSSDCGIESEMESLPQPDSSRLIVSLDDDTVFESEVAN